MTQYLDPHPDCPKCGSAMVRRRNIALRTFFWGCSDFPDCNGTRPLSEDGKAVRVTKSDEDDLLPSERYKVRDRARWRDE